MRNLLIDEWEERLRSAVTSTGANRAVIEDRRSTTEARWESRMMSCSLTLRGSIDGFMVPEVVIGSSSCAVGSPAHALAYYRQVCSLLEEALRVEGDLANVRVWFGECPCDHCSGRGEAMGKDCERCDGIGRRRW